MRPGDCPGRRCLKLGADDSGDDDSEHVFFSDLEHVYEEVDQFSSNPLN
jgi:hypothetical protein